MLDLQEVNRLLKSWAEWVLRRLDDGLGFPKETTLGRIRRLGPPGAAIRSGYGPRVIPGNGTAERVDKAIAKLSPCLRDAIKLHYLEGSWPDARKAKVLGLSYGGFRIRVNRAKHALRELLIQEKHAIGNRTQPIPQQATLNPCR